ncbi:mitochondrial mRNA pseudouridine synthase RPUSD3 isoform 3-T3 [Porphyrio hochstetteri]
MAGGGTAARALARVGNGARAARRGRVLGPEETLGLLEASVVYREGALLALSKPPGLPVLGQPEQLSLVALLPALRRRLGFTSELHVVKAPASAVTVGVPAEAEGEIRTGLRWQQHGDTALVVPVLAPGRCSLARKEVKNTLTRYRVLGAAGGCALLQLQPRTAFPEQLLVHLTLLLCPALGDHEHASRVGKVLGVPFLLPPEAAPTRTQVLDAELVARLGLSPQQLCHLPLHLHLQQLVLPQGLLCTPPPPYFLRTLRCLGLPGDQET